MKKRMTALVLSLFVLFLCGVPTAFAEEDSGLTEAVLLAKEKLYIPTACTEFSSRVENQQGITYYALSWNTPADTEKREYVHAEVTSFGEITSYNVSLPTNEDDRPSLPAISAEEAVLKAKDWVLFVNPSWADELNFDTKAYMGNVRYNDISVTFTREVNGVPVVGDYASMSLDKKSGEVFSFYSSWAYPKEIPSPEGVKSAEEAEKSRMEISGMTLRYLKKGDTKEAVLVYEPKDRNLWIDAFSGEEFVIEETDTLYRGEEAMKEDMSINASMGTNGLSDQEIAEISRMESLISEEQALELVKNLPNTGLSDFEAASISYSKIVREGREDRYEVSLRLEDEEAKGSAYATLDAESGALLSLSAYSYDETQKDQKPTSGQELLPIAEAFSEAVAPELFAETALFEDVTENTSRFLFKQSVSGVPYDGNYVSVSVDPYTQKVTGFGKHWEDMSFEDLSGIMSEEEAGKVLFEKIGLSLEYKKTGTRQAQTFSLVYVIKGGASAIGAKDGALLDDNAEPYHPSGGETVMPTDLFGHYAKDMVETLFLNNVLYLPKGETAFRPDDKITQKEALEFLSAFGNMPYSKPFNVELAYNGAISNRIMEASEKNPEVQVSREEAVQYIVRALGYREVAELEEIYHVGFPDAGAITKGREGYVALAKGLGIIKGDTEGNFNPKNIVTRAEFAVMVYNYLTK